jgi:hypothetical protein
MKRLMLVGLVGTLSCVAACSAEDAPPRPRPAVDAAAPTRTETATFSLG